MKQNRLSKSEYLNCTRQNFRALQTGKRTLLILIPGFPENEADSTCVPFPQTFIRNLKEADPSYNIIVLAFQYPFIKSVYTWNDIEVHSFNGRNKGKLSRLWLWKNIRRTSKKIIGRNKVVGVLSFWLGECALIGKYISHKYGIKHFSWIQGQDARPGNKFIRYINPAPDTLIALSDFVSDELFINYHIRPSHTIPLGIDPTTFAHNQSKRVIDLIGVGSLIELKRYDQFIDVVYKLKQMHPGIRTVICGDGDEREKLQRSINEKKLQQNIELLGELPHDEVLRLMQCSRILLHPSAYEGYGGVCAEALFAGAHVVSYCQPMKINFEQMHVVDNPDDMYPAVERLLSNTYLRHEMIKTYFISDICEKVLKLYLPDSIE